MIVGKLWNIKEKEAKKKKKEKMKQSCFLFENNPLK